MKIFIKYTVLILGIIFLSVGFLFMEDEWSPVFNILGAVMVASFFYPKKATKTKYNNKTNAIKEKYSKDKIIGLIGIGILASTAIFVKVSNHYMWFPDNRGTVVLILAPIMVFGLFLSKKYFNILFGSVKNSVST